MATPQEFPLPCEKIIDLKNHHFIFSRHLARSVVLGEMETPHESLAF